MKYCLPPKHIRDKAVTRIAKFNERQLIPRKTYRRGYLTMKVTPGWRLLSKDGGKTWLLLSHAQYDKIL